MELNASIAGNIPAVRAGTWTAPMPKASRFRFQSSDRRTRSAERLRRRRACLTKAHSVSLETECALYFEWLALLDGNRFPPRIKSTGSGSGQAFFLKMLLIRSRADPA